MPLSPEELQRYSRQIILPELGPVGQERLRSARVLVVGAGGLGGPVALYLAAAGVGEIGVMDPDRVEVTNLHRQVLFRTPDVGSLKVEAAARNLQSLNPGVRVVPMATALDAANAREVIAPWDLVLDGTDNFATRYVVNDACVLTGRRNVFASVLRFDGQVTVLGDPAGPCYRCLYPEPPPPGSVPSCAEAGVLGVLPGLLGMLQATEAIKLLTGIGSPLVGRMLLVDARQMRFLELHVSRRAECPACGTRTLSGVGAGAWVCAPTEVAPGAVREVAPRELARWREQGRPLQLVDVREGWEHALVAIPGALHLPLGMLPQRVHALDRHAVTVVYCHHGVRSRAAAEHLVEVGFGEVWNLGGGIDRWVSDVAPTEPRY